MHLSLFCSFFVLRAFGAPENKKPKKLEKKKPHKKSFDLFLLICSALLSFLLCFCCILSVVCFLANFWVSVLYLHSMYPINCLVYRGYWRGFELDRDCPVMSIALLVPKVNLEEIINQGTAGIMPWTLVVSMYATNVLMESELEFHS